MLMTHPAFYPYPFQISCVAMSQTCNPPTSPHKTCACHPFRAPCQAPVVTHTIPVRLTVIIPFSLEMTVWGVVPFWAWRHHQHRHLHHRRNWSRCLYCRRNCSSWLPGWWMSEMYKNGIKHSHHRQGSGVWNVQDGIKHSHHRQGFGVWKVQDGIKHSHHRQGSGVWNVQDGIKHSHHRQGSGVWNVQGGIKHSHHRQGSGVWNVQGGMKHSYHRQGSGVWNVQDGISTLTTDKALESEMYKVA